MIEIKLYIDLHKNKERLFAQFVYNQQLNKIIRSITGATWSQTKKLWHFTVNKEVVTLIQQKTKGVATLNTGTLKQQLLKRKQILSIRSNSSINNRKSPLPLNKKTITSFNISYQNLQQLELMIKTLQLKAYSESTIKTYKNEFCALLQILKNKDVASLTADEIKRYFLYCINTLHLSENSLHSRINALKFYFEQVLKRDKIFVEIPRPKKRLQLPKIFNQDEITAIIKATANLKHKVMLMLAYSAGLRVSEVVTIKTANIDSKRMCIFIENAKGKKDRMVALSPVLLIMLREYCKSFKPLHKGFLFSGQIPGEPYSTRSLQLVLNAAKQKAGIIKPGSIHALRHSFATHLLDKGTDVTMIMKLLGHNDIKTTLRYLHVTNRDMLQVISPLDDLVLD